MHPKTVQKYLHIALTAMATMILARMYRVIFLSSWCSLIYSNVKQFVFIIFNQHVGLHMGHVLSQYHALNSVTRWIMLDTVKSALHSV